jgi:acetate kinase
MTTPGRRVLTLNAGSSSLKFALYEAGPRPRRLVGGGFTRIGRPGTLFTVAGEELSEDASHATAAAEHLAALFILLEWISDRYAGEEPVAIGHRVVHGGPRYAKPQRVTSAMLTELRRICPLDPEHMPAAIQLIEACRKRFPTVPQVACFDTAFHHDMPRVAQIVPIPRRYEARGVRRYGFHGLSYEFLLEKLAEGAAPQGKVILAHLGSGASLAAVRDGRSMDTSMGFTPTGGIPMGTRSGDLDPGLAGFLAGADGVDAVAFSRMATLESGLLGVSQTSSDMRDLLDQEARDPRAAEAAALFCYQIKKWIGSFAAALGGLDTVVFSGGVGENAPVVRARICAGLDFLGIELDDARNARNDGTISTGRVVVRVIRTDEESIIARAALEAEGVLA